MKINIAGMNGLRESEGIIYEKESTYEICKVTQTAAVMEKVIVGGQYGELVQG